MRTRPRRTNQVQNLVDPRERKCRRGWQASAAALFRIRPKSVGALGGPDCVLPRAFIVLFASAVKPPSHCVTFRIANKTVGGKTYEDRYRKLIDNLTKEGLGYWDETTAFVLVESALDTFSFIDRAKSGLCDQDLLFVFDPSDMSAAYFGSLENRTVLKSFFPLLKQSA